MQRYQIVARLNGKMFYGREKRGDNLDWDDYLTYNISELESDDLELALYGDGQEIGAASLTYRRILREMNNDRGKPSKLSRA